MTDKNIIPPPLRQASTVILLRERNKAFEVYLLRRSTKSGFMGGLYVFPGGAVDPEDSGFDSWAPHIDTSRDQFSIQLGGDTLSDDDALGFSIAAIRETLEEAGVFMASDENKTKKDIDDMCTYRLNQDLPRSWFKTKVMNENWVLSLSSLGRWSHWIAPKLMKKRFDTRFFIVLMPDKQTCVPDNIETKQGVWITPQDALEQNLEARTPLSPPAVVTFTQLLKFHTLNDLKHEIQTRSWGDPIAPRLVPSPDGPVIIEPWDPMRHSEIKINTTDLPKKILPPGSAFSRIWCDRGVWKPVGI
jgi:hypothetical protein